MVCVLKAIPLSMRCVLVQLMILMAVSPVNAQERHFPKGLLLVADFNDKIQNRLDGYYNKFERPPSAASTYLVEEPRRGQSGRSLRVRVNRGEEGFCGVWLHMFDFRAQGPRAYFDARDYKYLSFWVRGEKGGEKFTIKLADKDWITKEDGLLMGPVSKFMPGRVGAYWKEVNVPLKPSDRLDLSQLGGITLAFDTVGQHTIYIDDIAFKKKRRLMTPATRRSNAKVAEKKRFPRAMWIWSTAELMKDPEACDELLAFCKQENINQLWIQVLYHFEPRVDLSQVLAGGVPAGVRCVMAQTEPMRKFLAQAHDRSISVHALDGYPEFAQKPFHPLPLAIVDAVIQFNEQSEPSQRFDGIHFDNEPYLITGSRDRERNQKILRDFLALNAECQRRVKEATGLVYGIDIPFFWHEIDAQTGHAIGRVEFRGATKSVSFHCIDMLDNVGIMNYRDTADGADGMIVHGQALLDYGDQVNRAEVYMGVETFSYEDRACWFAVGLPREKFARAIETTAADLSLLSRVNGFRKQVFDDGTSIHVGIELPAKPTPEQNQRAKETMILIARKLGVSGDPALRANVERLTTIARRGFAADVEWAAPKERDIVDLGDGKVYAGLEANRIMLSKVTFAQEQYQEIMAQMDAAESFFSRSKSYAGIAIHYYKTYRAKVEAAKKASP